MPTPESVYRGPIRVDANVLGERLLTPGRDLSCTSRFGDDRWDLTPAIHQKHKRSLVLDFTTVPECVRWCAKELFYALLSDQVAGEDQIHIVTVRAHFTAAKSFLNWVHDEHHHGLSVLTEGELKQYAKYIRNKGVSRATQTRHLWCATLFWRYRTKLAADKLVVDPARIRSWGPSGTANGPRVENMTDRIPEQIMAPLLVWALRWVNDFSTDVVAAYEEWRHLYDRTPINRFRNRGGDRSGNPRRSGGVERVRKLLDDYRKEGRPLPGSNGKPNFSHLAREADVVPSTVKRGAGRQLLDAALPGLGVADASYLRAQLVGQLDGACWRGPIAYHEIAEMMRLLHAAAYIVIAYLSGMRDSEVKHLRKGCIRSSCRSDGTVHRRKITSLAFKGESDVRGVSASWVVTEPVEQAVAVLERICGDGSPYLFGKPPTSRSYYRQNSKAVASTHTTNEYIAAFMQWINKYCDDAGRTDRLPLVAGREVRVTARQFRRTLAWFIAREPGGVIAGAMAYRHVSVQMFEGYAGTSDSGFRAEVQAESAIMRAEVAGELVTSSEYLSLTGPSAKEAERRLARFARHVVFDGRVIADRKRLERELNRHDHRIFFGQFVTCVYDPDRALCLREKSSDDKPSMPDCVPLRCRNVALTEDNREAVAAHLADLDVLIENTAAWAPYVLHRLEMRRAEVAQFLNNTRQARKIDT